VALDDALLLFSTVLVHCDMLWTRFYLVGCATAAAVRRSRRVSVGRTRRVVMVMGVWRKK
jgi:hypothetical protein